MLENKEEIFIGDYLVDLAAANITIAAIAGTMRDKGDNNTADMLLDANNQIQKFLGIFEEIFGDLEEN